MIITPFYAGLLALWFVVLSLRVILRRAETKVRLEDAGDVELTKRIRGQANFAEYVPLALLLIGYLELSHYPAWLLHALGLSLFVGRVLHGITMSFDDHLLKRRWPGIVLTLNALGISGTLCIWQGLRGFSLGLG